MIRPRRRPAPPRTPAPRAASASLPRTESLEPRTHLSASLVADVQQGSGDASPTVLTPGPSRLFFRAWDGTTVGNEPYTLAAQFSPSQSPRATLLKDINPNGDSTYQNFAGGGPPPPTPAIAVGDGFYFSAYNQTVGLELYYTDGTAAGTRLVADVRAGPGNSSPDNFLLVPDPADPAAHTLYFTAETYSQETGFVRSLYRTDGTAAGTAVVRNAAGFPSAGAAVGVPLSMAHLTGVAYFTTAVGLYRVDPAGAVPVKTQPFSPSVAPARSLVAFDGALYYKYGTDLWRSDGTAANTVSLATVGIVRPTHVQSFDGLVAAGDLLYFAGNSAEAGVELWRTDGTPEGTGLVKDVYAGTEGAWPNRLTTVDGTLYFTASAAAGVGESVWKTGGTAETTALVHSLPGAGLPNPAGRPFKELAAVGDTLYFTVASGPTGNALWRTVGAPGGATPQTTQRVNAPVTEAHSLTPFAGRLHFAGRNIDGLELWSTDGTAAGSTQVQDLNARHATNRTAPEGLAEINGRLVFATDDGFGNRRLYSAAGTGGPVTELAVLRRAFKSVRLGDRLYFTSGVEGEELWSTDGTAAGTDRIRSFARDPHRGAAIGRLTSIAGMLLFFAADEEHGREMWVSDGTLGGTRMLKEFTPGPEGTFTVEDASWPRMVEAGGHAYFTHANGIYRTDGTTEGTLLLRFFPNGHPDRPVSLGDRVLFTVPNPGFFREQLYVTRGTIQTTTLVHEALTAHSFAALNDFVAFWGNGGLWRSDGTPAGTYPIWEAEPGVMMNPNFLTAWNGAIYFRADSGLWKTDGTKPGTVRIMTPAGRQAGLAGFGPFVPLGDHLYFAGADAERGAELWRTEGTSAIAVGLTDILPGPGGSSPGNLIAAGDALYFFAEDGVHGREPWRYVPGAPAVTVAGRHVFYNNSAFDNRDPAATLADLNAVAPDKAALLPGGTATFAHVTSYTRGLNGVLVDFAGIPPAPLTAADFDFRTGRLGDPSGWRTVAPASVTQLIGPIASNVARYAITFADGAVRNTWLRVTIKANANTALGADDVFYYGNLVGDTGASLFRVDTSDYIVTLGSLNKSAGLPAKTDFDRNGRTNSADLLLARHNRGHTLGRLEPQSPVAPAGSAIAPMPPRRRAAYDIL